MGIKKGLTILTAFALVFSYLTTNIEASSAPFSQGNGYMQGAYDSSAMQPIGHNWNHNSRFAGVSKNLHIKWIFQKSGSGQASLTIDSEGNLYSTSYNSLGSPKSSLYSISPDGTERWKYSSDLSMLRSSPVIRSNKEILMNVGHELNSIDPNTGIPTKKIADISSGLFFVEPVIDSNGVIYTFSAAGPSLVAYNPDGTIKWSKQLALKNFSQISLSADGTLYFYNNGKLNAYNSLNGDMKWEYSIMYDPNHKSAPTIDSSGNVYIVDNVGTISAINPNGSVKWQYLTEKLSNSSTRDTIDPFVGLDGTIYASNGYRNLYALDQNGSLKWTFNTTAPVSSSIIDKNNKIYISVGKNVISLDSNGNQLWAIETDIAVMGSSLSIAEDGTIYVVTGVGKIFAIGGDIDDSVEPTEPPIDPKPPVDPVGERAIFVLTLSTGIEKEYDLSMQEVQEFISWYESRAAGSGPITFAINKHNNNKGPFKQRQDYIVFDKIITFEVNEY